MLSTGFPQFWGWLALGLGAFATVIAFSAVNEARKMANYVAQCTEYLNSNNLQALKDSKIGGLETAMVELADTVTSLEASHKRLRAKYGMRDLRERRAASDDARNGELDLAETKDKSALRLELMRKGLLK